MEQTNEVVERYLAVWNETDPIRRRALIAQTWTEAASYLDPLMQGNGHAEIDAMVQAAQAQFTGYRFRPIGGIDSHHNHIRFSWELAPEGGAVVVAGTDFGVVAADGRLQSVIGFLDQVPMGA